MNSSDEFEDQDIPSYALYSSNKWKVKKALTQLRMTKKELSGQILTPNIAAFVANLCIGGDVVFFTVFKREKHKFSYLLKKLFTKSNLVTYALTLIEHLFQMYLRNLEDFGINGFNPWQKKILLGCGVEIHLANIFWHKQPLCDKQTRKRARQLLKLFRPLFYYSEDIFADGYYGKQNFI